MPKSQISGPFPPIENIFFCKKKISLSFYTSKTIEKTLGHLILRTFAICNPTYWRVTWKDNNMSRRCLSCWHLQLPRGTPLESGDKILRNSSKIFFLHPDVRSVLVQTRPEARLRQWWGFWRLKIIMIRHNLKAMPSSEIFLCTSLSSSRSSPSSPRPFLLPASNIFFKYLQWRWIEHACVPTVRATWWFPRPCAWPLPACWRPRSSERGLSTVA